MSTTVDQHWHESIQCASSLVKCVCGCVIAVCHRRIWTYRIIQKHPSLSLYFRELAILATLPKHRLKTDNRPTKTVKLTMWRSLWWPGLSLWVVRGALFVQCSHRQYEYQYQVIHVWVKLASSNSNRRCFTEKSSPYLTINSMTW